MAIVQWLNGQPLTVVIGLIYGYVPFFILPLYATLDRIDGRLLEAARDLGATSRQDVLASDAAAVAPGPDRRVRDHRAADVSATTTPTISCRGRRARRWSATRSSTSSQQTTQPQVGASLVLILLAVLLGGDGGLPRQRQPRSADWCRDRESVLA